MDRDDVRILDAHAVDEDVPEHDPGPNHPGRRTGTEKFAKSHSIPWGISESSCAKLSVDGHYHYQAFGVPALAINQEKPEDLVVSPYSTFLALLADTEGAVENVRNLEVMGLLGPYGFYEAVDFTPSRVQPEALSRSCAAGWRTTRA